MKKRKSYIVIFVCILVAVSITIININNIFKCEITDISVGGILEYPGRVMTTSEFLEGFSGDYRLDYNMKKGIKLEPQKYKIVDVHFKIKKIYKFITSSDASINAKYSLNLSNMEKSAINTIQPDDTPLIRAFRQDSNDGARFMFIVKANNESNEEIKEYVEKSTFLLE
ncbi:MAG: hypothetical protein ACLS28_15045 [Clostridium neonatale]